MSSTVGISICIRFTDLPKCIVYLIQNSPAVKKVCGPKKTIVKKDVKSGVAAKKWLTDLSV